MEGPYGLPSWQKGGGEGRGFARRDWRVREQQMGTEKEGRETKRRFLQKELPHGHLLSRFSYTTIS